MKSLDYAAGVLHTSKVHSWARQGELEEPQKHRAWIVPLECSTHSRFKAGPDKENLKSLEKTKPGLRC